MSNKQYIIATHGRLAEGFKNTIELLTHKRDIHSVTAYLDDEFPKNLIALMDTFAAEETIIVFTDLICGSVTQKIMELYSTKQHIHLFAGINLSLILEVLLNEQELDEAYCNLIVQGAREQICYLPGTFHARK